ncbi:MAG TPA: metallophosphoesterase [Gemmatimonadales bacterium]|jgi:DNA repair exonuclease SbcCD nuclease subunit
MRLAHIADPHLGFRQYHRLTERGRNQREADVSLAFTRAIDGVIAERPDIVVVAGDLFHAARPTNSAILQAVREFSRLGRALPGVPVVLIAGNHDTPRSTETASIFGLFHELGLLIATDAPRRFAFPELDLAILAVPHQALEQTPRPAIEPLGDASQQVLLIHGEIPALFPNSAAEGEPGGAMLTPEELRGPWSYVALGHYHVQCAVGERQWYAGSLDYCSSNPWGECRTERAQGVAGKGWLLYDSVTGDVSRRPIEAPRRVFDLPALRAADLNASELDRLLAEAVEGAPGGIAGAVVRQVVLDVARPVARELNHARIRAWKAEALHFQLDLRRPEPVAHLVGVGAPGVRQTLPDIVRSYTDARVLPAEIERPRFVARALEFLAAVDPVTDDG